MVQQGTLWNLISWHEITLYEINIKLTLNCVVIVVLLELLMNILKWVFLKDSKVCFKASWSL